MKVSNPAPPYRQPTPDPKTGYFTRWLGTLVSIFVPSDSSARNASRPTARP